MSARVIEAVNTMISHRENISSVIKNGSEYIFCYMDKYVWGITKIKDPSDYALFYYPNSGSTQELATVTDWNKISFVAYSSKEIGTPEARSSMEELMTVVQEKLHGVDEILDRIISG
ncbi:MAG: hypothetical protein F4222_07900 [Gammaproteobacteria bacterium]|nr:hypothetical protein [Gammaproteobacteria bacterium]MYF58975.1 hypothetical protein [Gammaproteobacteria bacterium]